MALSLGTPHHIRFTVTDIERSTKFYSELLGLQVAAAEAPPEGHEFHEEVTETLQDGVILSNGAMLIGLRPVDARTRGTASTRSGSAWTTSASRSTPAPSSTRRSPNSTPRASSTARSAS